MPSAANGKSEKPASAEALDNSPIRQVMTIIEHKIRNLEKRKGKLDQYRNLQKAGKDLEKEQKVALTKWDEVNLTLDYSREFSKQITQIAITAERDAKKQAKKDAWVRYAADTNKIREVLLVLDCLNMMGTDEVREDFLNGSNGAAKLTKEELKILDDLYPEVSPKHEPNEEGQPGFHAASVKAAELLCSITEGKGKEILGTTFTHIKEIVTKVHECGYFDKVPEPQHEVVEPEPEPQPQPVQPPQPSPPQPEPEARPSPPPAPTAFPALPVPPAPGVVPAPAYPLRPLPPITLQEVEHAYFAHQYPQQRPIAEVIGSQNFFFLQESELDSPNGTPQPPMQPSPPQGIPSQTFTNQHFIPGHEPMPPQPHFAPIEHGFPPGAVLMPHMVQHPHQQMVNHVSPPAAYGEPAHAPLPPQPAPAPAPLDARPAASPENEKQDDDWKETRSPERDDTAERRTQGQGDGQGRFRRYGGGGGGGSGRGGGRGAPNGHGRGRGSFRQGDGYRPRDSDGYRGRNSDYQGRNADGNRSDNYRNSEGYQGRQNKDRHNDRDNYQSRRSNDDGYYGNGDAGDERRERSREHAENGREHHYRDYKGQARGRGAPRSRPPRAAYPARKQDE